MHSQIKRQHSFAALLDGLYDLRSLFAWNRLLIEWTQAKQFLPVSS